MSCNTNNGTERINGDLKHDELEEYRNCSLSELLEIIIDKFLPKLYKRYVSLNVKFSSGYKKYAYGVPEFLHDRPRSLVIHLLDKIQKVTSEMVSSIQQNDDGTFLVESDEPNVQDNKRKYIVYFGNDLEPCSCSCRDFRRTRLLYKHFFAIIESQKKSFYDISSGFLNHPFTNLDCDLFQNQIENLRKDDNSHSNGDDFYNNDDRPDPDDNIDHTENETANYSVNSKQNAGN